jgi:hypothetical protein
MHVLGTIVLVAFWGIVAFGWYLKVKEEGKLGAFKDLAKRLAFFGVLFGAGAAYKIFQLFR